MITAELTRKIELFSKETYNKEKAFKKFMDKMYGAEKMVEVNLNNPSEIRTVGLQALKDALGPVGMARFIQQFDLGHGDYTKEKQDAPDVDFDEIDALLNA